MAKTKTRKSAKRNGTRNGRKPSRAVATRDNKRVPAFAYDERRPIVADELRHRPNHSATIAELFADLESAQFRTPRRVAATFRADQRLPQSERLFARGIGNMITLVKRNRTERNGARVSKRATKRSR